MLRECLQRTHLGKGGDDDKDDVIVYVHADEKEADGGTAFDAVAPATGEGGLNVFTSMTYPTEIPCTAHTRASGHDLCESDSGLTGGEKVITAHYVV